MASTSYSASLPKPGSKASFRRPSAFDLYHQLIYMSAVASAGVSRNRLFQLAAKSVRAPGDYFERIRLLCEKLGYNYPSACNLVGLRTKDESMRTLLLRFADALSSGHPEVSFLTQEAQVQRDAYEKEYERNLASLTKWTDAYGAVVVSATLIIIVNLTSTMIYDLGLGATLALVITAIVASAGGAWVVSRAAPSEPEARFTTQGSHSQVTALMLARVIPTATIIVCALLALLRVPMGWILLVGGGMLLPLGVYSLRAAKEIERKDREIGPFLRSLGAVASSTGSTLSQALTLIDLDSFPNLSPDMKRLGSRFKASISSALCWNKFALETGSRLIGETITVFYDAIQLGGDADMVGSLCSQFATTEVMLRARRKVIASTFSGLTIVMHAVTGTLLILILEVIRKFTGMIAAAASAQGQAALRAMQMPMLTFGSPLLSLLGTLTSAMVVIFAVIHAFAIIAADGGHLLKASFYLGVLLILSGLSFILVPPFVDSILKVT